jgi:hypothetical protein
MAVVSFFLVAACSLPDITIDKQKRAANGDTIASFSQSNANSGKDKRYLATVHIRFSDAKDATPISFDIRRDKRSLIAAKLWQTEKASAVMHLGYTRHDGPIAGLRFNWRF